MKLTEFCIRRPVTTGMFYLALLILGLISSSKMPIDLFPQVTYPAINISTSYTGAGPEEIERLITIPIEKAVSTINGVKSITANSQEGSSRVTVNFDWGCNLDEATNDIRANVDRMKGRLPDAADTPTISKYDPSQSPVLTLGLSGRMDEVTLRKIAEDDVSYLLQRIEGVARVEVRGGKTKEIKVAVQQERLQAFRITAEQLVSAIKSENAMTPAGYLAVGAGDFLLRTKGELQSLDEIRNLVVAQRDGIPIYLRDLATIEEGYQAARSLVRIDGRSGIVLSLSKRSGANSVAVADRVYQVLDQIQKTHPDINLRVLNDDSIYIRRAVGSVSESAIVGAVLAGLILLFFFHNLRATLITGAAMPISIMITLILAYFCKMTLNTISLGGLALGVGMLVDNAVVVLDNIFRHHQQNGGDMRAAALEGTAEMGPAISASTLTHICVFLPLIFLTGRNGIIFKELSYMVIFSILCSLLVAVTLIPMLCTKFLKVRAFHAVKADSLAGKLIAAQNGWESAYERTLQWCLDRKARVVLGGLGVFLATLTLFPLIGTELIQTTDEGVIAVNLQLPTGTRLEETDQVVLQLERYLRKNLPELANLEASVGGRTGGGGNPNQGYLTLRLKAKAERRRSTQQVVDELQAKLEVPGARLRITIPNSMRMLYGGSQNPIAIDVRGYDQQQSRRIATEIMDVIGEIPGIINVSMSREEERPELAIMIDRKRAADYGVTAAAITAAVQINIEGKVATTFRKNGEEIQVRVNLQEADRRSWQDLNRIMISGSNNRVVPLSSLVTLLQTNSPVGIERKDQERNVTVSAGLAKRDLASAMDEIKKRVAQVKLPDGIKVVYAGDYEEQRQSAKEFQMVLILALLLVYIVMAAQFESFFDPFVIMLSVPFALSGVLLMLLLTDTLFNNQVSIGLIMLGGVVVNNAIVMISYIRLLIERGVELRTAVLEGCKSRLRPVLITTATTILGLVPLALGIGEGAETQAPLARTVIGGLLCSTVLTLLLIPLIFTALESRLSRMKQRLRKSSVLALLVIGLMVVGGMPSLEAEAPSVRELTVAQAVNLALANHEDGKIFQKKRAIAEAAYLETMGDKAVQLFSALESNAKVGQGENPDLELSINAAKTVPLVNLFGVKSLSDKVAEANREMTLNDLEWQEQKFIYQVIAAYQQQLLAKRDLQLAEENSKRAQRTYDEVMARSKLGLTTLSDETGAASQKATAKTKLNRSHQLYRLAQIKLCQYLGVAETVEMGLAEPNFNFVTLELGQLLTKARRNRADVKAVNTGADRAALLLQLAQLSQRLGISLEWNLNRDHLQWGVALGNWESSSGSKLPGEWRLSGSGGVLVSEPDSKRDDAKWGAVTLNLKWKLLDGQVRKQRIKQAELLKEQWAEEVQKSEKNLDYEVQEAYYNYLYQQDQLHSSQLQLNYNQTYFEATQAKLRVGLAAVKDVLEAQDLYSQSEVRHERVKSDLYLAWVDLLKVCGELTPQVKL